MLPAPGDPGKKKNKSGGDPGLHFPSRKRQADRLETQFLSLQQALERRSVQLRADSSGILPEEVIVLETAGPIENFIVAIRRVDGLEWLGEIEEEDLPPNDDFFITKKTKTGDIRTDKLLRGRMFMVFTNQRALQQLLSLWDSWKKETILPRGWRKWNSLFGQLIDVRLWGVTDRLLETGVLDDWRERVEHNEEVVPCEIELWFRNDPRKRQAARDRVESFVIQQNGRIVRESVIDEIAYHGLLMNLPLASVQALLQENGRDAALVQCEQIQFFRSSGQMAVFVNEDNKTVFPVQPLPSEGSLGAPVVALLDGLPLQNHNLLRDRLIIDDPDNYENAYTSNERKHGTAMASLILRGDLDGGETALNRKIYVRPILRPDPKQWNTPRREIVPDDVLVVDLIHRAIRRLFESDEGLPAVAPEICVVNLSIGIRDRLFDNAISPLARLLDWLSWKYRVLFIISAGNHENRIEIRLSRQQFEGLTHQQIQDNILRAVAEDARNRRLLSPAESVNGLTIAAVHQDFSNAPAIQDTIIPFIASGLPSIFNAQGMGYRRSVKPEILFPGGGVLLRSSFNSEGTLLELINQARPPGQKVAAPGSTPGDLSFSWHTRGTSNSAALASRAASQLYDVLVDLRNEQGGELIDLIPRSVWLKALLVHGASWGGAYTELERVLQTAENNRQFKEYLTRLLGYGAVDARRAQECTSFRATALGGGLLQADQAHIHRIPLPDSLNGLRVWKRLVITLAWLTPINTAHQAWRRADLWFTPPLDILNLSRREADWQIVQRGTVQHEIMDGEQASVFANGDHLEINVSCRPDAGVLEEPVPYALATTLEISEQADIDIYNEIRVKIHSARVQVFSP